MNTNATITVTERQTDLHSVEASIYFLKKALLYETEKPYAFRYEVEFEDVPQSNMEMEKVEHISITDIRAVQKEFSIDVNGFTVVRLNSSLRYEDFYDPHKVKTYFGEVEHLLEKQLGASKVEIFRHGIRKRHPDFPTSTGKAYEYDQPTSVAHIDTTKDEIFKEIHRQHGPNCLGMQEKRVQWINIWKPLKGPLNDWPLTVCDSSTVREETDFEPADLLYPDLATENFQVYHTSRYRWYYLSNHMPSEILVFKQADSLSGTTPGVPHCSFYNTEVPESESPRESIEARALVYYD